MADEIKIIRWCDLCPPSSTPAERRWQVSITLDGTRGNDLAARQLDTCGEHAGPLEAILGDLRAHGRIIRPPRPGRAPSPPTGTPPETPPPGPQITCPCGETLHRNSLREHARAKHRIKTKVPTRCPDCGARFGTAQAMAGHRAKAHGYDAIADLLTRIEEKL